MDLLKEDLFVPAPLCLKGGAFQHLLDLFPEQALTLSEIEKALQIETKSESPLVVLGHFFARKEAPSILSLLQRTARPLRLRVDPEAEAKFQAEPSLHPLRDLQIPLDFVLCREPSPATQAWVSFFFSQARGDRFIWLENGFFPASKISATWRDTYKPLIWICEKTRHEDALFSSAYLAETKAQRQGPHLLTRWWWGLHQERPEPHPFFLSFEAKDADRRRRPFLRRVLTRLPQRLPDLFSQWLLEVYRVGLWVKISWFFRYQWEKRGRIFRRLFQYGD